MNLTREQKEKFQIALFDEERKTDPRTPRAVYTGKPRLKWTRIGGLSEWDSAFGHRIQKHAEDAYELRFGGRVVETFPNLQEAANAAERVR